MSFLAKMEEDLKFARWAYANGKFQEGLAVSERYVGPTSRSRDFLFTHATLLFGMSRFTEAEQFFARSLELDPSNMEAIARRIDCLLYTGRREQAAEQIGKARERFPDHGGLMGTYLCELLTDKGPQAAIAALDAELKSPDRCKNIETAVEFFRQKLLFLHDLVEIRSFDPRDLLGLAKQEGGSGYKLSDIYEQFESLGANCDFGFIQRTRRAEPLSLFRWTSITPANLARLLKADLAGYDTASHYSLTGAHEKEYMLYESAYETVGHTGVNSADIPHDEFLERLTRRQTFLTRKFLAELAAGKKIFLYKAKEAMTGEEIDAIDRELLRLGARRTMFTMPTADPAKAGTIEFPTSTRAIAYLSNRPFTEIMNEWDRIIVAAYDHFQRSEAQAA